MCVTQVPRYISRDVWCSPHQNKLSVQCSEIPHTLLLPRNKTGAALFTNITITNC